MVATTGADTVGGVDAASSSPASTSATSIVQMVSLLPPSVMLARRWPVGSNDSFCQLLLALCTAGNEARRRRAMWSQRMTVSSHDTEAIILPIGSNAAEVTGPTWPSSTSSVRTVSTLQRRTVRTQLVARQS